MNQQRDRIVRFQLDLPAHYSIEGMCAACRGGIKSGDDRYRIGEREYHAHCFDISNIGTTAGVASTTVRPLSSRSDRVAISDSEAPGALPVIHPGRPVMRNPGWRQNFEGWLRRKTTPAPPVPKPARPPRRPRPPRTAPPKPR